MTVLKWVRNMSYITKNFVGDFRFIQKVMIMLITRGQLIKKLVYCG